MRYYWKNGFYAGNAGTVPDGAVELTEERYLELMEGQQNGKEITTGEDGFPVLSDPVSDPKAIALANAHEVLKRLQRQEAVRSIPLDDDATALVVAPLCPDWAAGATYQAGEVVNHDGQAFRVIQAVTALENQPPGAEGMLAIYRPLDEKEHTGRLDDPIPYVHGMDVSAGFFYSFEGKTYLANANMKPCVWDPGTEGLWQWEEVN